MVRNFQEDPIPDGVVQKIMELAQHYPSAGFSQGVAFVVVRDSETKKKIGGEEKISPNGFHNFVSYAPVIVLVCASEQAYHRRYQEPDKLIEGKEIEWPTPYWFFDAGAASMIILLSAIDQGYAAAFSGVPVEDIARVKGLLGIPDEYHPVGIISIGRPAPDKKSPSLKRGRRKPEDVVHYERW
jgi:nitroreductase